MAQRHDDWLAATFSPEERAEIEAEGQQMLAAIEARERMIDAVIFTSRPGARTRAVRNSTALPIVMAAERLRQPHAA